MVKLYRSTNDSNLIAAKIVCSVINVFILNTMSCQHLPISFWLPWIALRKRYIPTIENHDKLYVRSISARSSDIHTQKPYLHSSTFGRIIELLRGKICSMIPYRQTFCSIRIRLGAPKSKVIILQKQLKINFLLYLVLGNYVFHSNLNLLLKKRLLFQ